jgi:hypothetical protein
MEFVFSFILDSLCLLVGKAILFWPGRNEVPNDVSLESGCFVFMSSSFAIYQPSSVRRSLVSAIISSDPGEDLLYCHTE